MPDRTIKLINRRTFLMSAIPFAAMAVAGCTPAYVNRQDFGEAATGAEIKAHLSGKSVRYASTAKGPVDFENYYGADGTFKSVSLDKNFFAIGTWRIHSSLGTDHLMTQYDGYYVGSDGVGRSAQQGNFIFYIQPDGSAVLDEMGGGNFSQPKPRRGFPAEARWNSLMQKARV